MTGTIVVSVSASAAHGFIKSVCPTIRLIAGYGVEGDAHAGAYVKHRYLARWRPKLSNERQVHLMEVELFDELKQEGFTVGPGQLGENITTRASIFGGCRSAQTFTLVRKMLWSCEVYEHPAC